MSEQRYPDGSTVQIAYTGYTVTAKVLEYEPSGRYGPQRGWYMVEQISDYEDQPEGERPQYEAHEDYMAWPDEARPFGPFETLYQALEGARARR